jgi:hypothetical protein
LNICVRQMVMVSTKAHILLESLRRDLAGKTHLGDAMTASSLSDSGR